VNLSVDGLPAMHNSIRGVPNAFQKVIETHRCLAALQQQRRNIAINVNITISRSNQNQTNAIIRFLRKTTDVRNITTTLTRGKPRVGDESYVDLNKYYKTLEALEQHVKKQPVNRSANSFFDCLLNAQHLITRKRIYHTLKTNAWSGPCYAGTLSCLVSSNGDVYPCELIKESLGNVTRTPFNEIWASPATRDACKRVKECFCTHENFILVNVLFNLGYWPALVKEATRMLCRQWSSRLCEKTIRLCQWGP
jgi:MoaA/NifB/PqqE/SkfB family radical SAM enzyme